MGRAATVELDDEYDVDADLERRNSVPLWFHGLTSIGGLCSTLVVIVNNIGSIIAGIWLLALGEWKAVGYGLAAMFCGPMFLGWIMLLISLPFMPLVSAAKRSLGLTVLATVGTSWARYFVISIWMVNSFNTLIHMTKPEAFIPSCIVGLAVAVTPWISMGSQERDNEHTLLSLAGIAMMGLVQAIGFGAFHWDVHTAFWITVGFFNAYTFVSIKVAAIASPDLPRLNTLKWYEAMWSYFPAIFVLIGGYVWGALGVGAAYANRRIFSSRIHPAIKFLSTGAISTCLFGLYLATVILITLATKK